MEKQVPQEQKGVPVHLVVQDHLEILVQLGQPVPLEVEALQEQWVQPVILEL